MEAERETWHLPDGTPYEGEVFEDDKGRPFGEHYVDCWKCGGSGRWRGRKVCHGCGGEKVNFEQTRIYTGAQHRAREAAKERRRKKKDEVQAAREAEAQERHDAFVAANAALMERAEAESANKFIANLLEKSRRWGGLTEGQADALRAVIAKMDSDRADYSTSRAIGAPGERIEVEVVCRDRLSFFRERFRGRGTEEVFVTQMIDGEGNAFVTVTPSFALEPGDRAVLRGTVKGHDDRRGWTATRLKRVSVLDHRPANVVSQDAEPEPAGAFAP